MGLRRTLRKLLGYKEPSKFINESFAQEGEDMVLDRMFNMQQHGFFVDVGALHPMRFSNTYKFYKRGWRGINIDALPGSMELFNKLRPEDINIEAPISNTVETLPFYVFNDNALNTFSKQLAEERNNKPEFSIVKTINIETKKLQDILDKHLPPGKQIDFLTIDAEGFDLKILMSNNWERYAPYVVVIETDYAYREILDTEICKYLQQQGYEIFAKTVKSCFFVSKGFTFQH